MSTKKGCFDPEILDEVAALLKEHMPDDWGLFLMIGPKKGPGIVGDALSFANFDDEQLAWLLRVRLEQLARPSAQ